MNTIFKYQHAKTLKTWYSLETYGRNQVSNTGKLSFDQLVMILKAKKVKQWRVVNVCKVADLNPKLTEVIE